MNQFPVNTICLLTMCYLCKILNMAMLDKIVGDEIVLIVEDDVDCARTIAQNFGRQSWQSFENS